MQASHSVDVPRCMDCNRDLAAPVLFCPFCGRKQLVVSLIKPPKAAPAPKPPAEPGPAPPAAAPAAAPPKRLPAVSLATGTPPSEDSTSAGIQPSPHIANLTGEPARTDTAAAPAKRLKWPILLAAAGAAAFLAWFFMSPPPTVGTGTVTVVVKQPDGRPFSDGVILVDGQSAGSPGTTITVQAGTVTIGVAAQGWAADPQRLEMRTGVATRAELTLRALPARVTVVSTPSGATCRVDGRWQGAAPVEALVPTGRHEIAVSLEGYDSKTMTLSLARGEDRRIDLDLVPVQPQPPPFERGVTTGPVNLYSAPSPTSATGRQFDVGQDVVVAGQIVVNGQHWLAVRNSNSRLNYLSPDAPLVSWPDWWRQNSVSGTIDSVLADYRLLIGGRTITLFGVRAPQVILRQDADAAYHRVLRQISELLLGKLTQCEPQTTRRHACFIEGRDIAELFLRNGAAIVDSEMKADYVDMQTQAAAGRRGLWSQP